MTAPSLFIAVPSQGQIRSETTASLMKVQYRLQQQGIAMVLQQYQSADIVGSRNLLASNFLLSRRFTHLLFVDSDMSFEPEAIQRLMDFGEPLTAQICPRRTLDLDRLRTLIEAEATHPPAARTPTPVLMARAADYAVRLGNWDGTPATPTYRDGFLSVPGLGAAVMLVRRDVLQTMVAREVAPVVGTREAAPGGHKRTIFGFFSPLDDGAPDRPLSEDLGFCKRWVANCGGQIWADTETPITHHGSWGYTGRYAEVVSAGRAVQRP